MSKTLRYTAVVILCLAHSLLCLKAQPAFHPFPKASGKYWALQVPEQMRADYIRLGNQYLHEPWQAIPDSIFAEFRTCGNRTHYEALSFGIRKQMACLVMAEIMEGKRRFLPAIRQGLHYFIEKEPWWGIPAHYPKAKPERQTQVVDLFNAETASLLAWTLYMLGDDIEWKEPGLCESVRQEIQTRFLDPTLYEPQGWKHNANNWNTWITSNWLVATLICEKDVDKRRKALKGIRDDLMLFLDGYPDDGACEEGVAYWDRAAASLFESLYFLQFIADDPMQLTEAQRQKVHRMGQFITTMHVHDFTFVNYSDAATTCVPNANILFPYGAYEQDSTMMQLAAYIGEQYHYREAPSFLFEQSGNYPTLGRELMLLSMLPQYIATPAEQPQTVDAFMENSQIMVASTDSTTSKASAQHHWLISAKGGNNAESHNHNDIGNFVIYHDQQPVVIDLGRDTYTSLTFSARRFELMNNRSAYHNVPLIQGCEQKDGKQYRASAASHTYIPQQLSSLSLSIASAYPKEAAVEKWDREIALDRKRNRVRITESFEMKPSSDKLSSDKASSDKLSSDKASSDKATELVLMTCGEPRQGGKGRILLQGGHVVLAYPASSLTASWEKVQMADGIMKEQWHDNVYRIKLSLTAQKTKGRISYYFESKK